MPTAFSKCYATVLNPFVKDYQLAKNDKGRKAVLKDAVDAVKENEGLLEEKGVSLPQDLEKSIIRYIKRCIKKESDVADVDPKPKKIKQVYTVRDVIKQTHRDLVEAENPHKSTEKKYIGGYQRAVTAVLNNMDDGEREKVEKVVDSWNQEGAPPEVQLKMARTKLPKDIRKKVDQWKFQSGALILCLVAYSDGKNVQAFKVESPPVVGSGFTNSCNDWMDGTYDKFTDWATKQFDGKDLDSEDEGDAPLHMQKAKNIVFKKNESGDFILPPKTDYKNIKQKQRVVRGYVGAVYREFTGSSRSAFPYLLAAEIGQKIFSPDCVPEGFSLGDPDHLKSSQIDMLYSHWLIRQKAGLPPFVVLNPGPHDGRAPKRSINAKGKQKTPYVDVSDDDDSDGSEEDDSSTTEDSEGERSDDEEEDDRVVKFGPPVGKERPKFLPSTQIDENSAQFAESSTAALTKQDSRKTNSKRKIDASKSAIPAKENSLKKTMSKKRQLEDDSESVLPGPKLGKKQGGKKSRKQAGDKPDSTPAKIGEGTRNKHGDGRETTRKRKQIDEHLVDGQESNPKRKKLDEPKPTPRGSRRSPLPAVSPKRKKSAAPPQPEARAREASRVKDFPAGNTATSASRIAFLRSLCNVPKFSDLVDLVPAVPKASTIPGNYPSWVSWSSREHHLPPEFHSSKMYKKALSVVKAALREPSVFEDGKIDSPLLLLGLMYREVSRAMEIEPGETTTHPTQLINSPFGVKEVKEITALINSVAVASDRG